MALDFFEIVANLSSEEMVTTFIGQINKKLGRVRLLTIKAVTVTGTVY